MSVISMKQLLEAGVHFGHQTRRWNPKTVSYTHLLMCMNMMQVAIIFFFLTFGQKEGANLPVAMNQISSVDAYINPLPHALMLTAIVVSLGTCLLYTSRCV